MSHDTELAATGSASADSRRTWWMRQALSNELGSAPECLTGHERVDVCIVGGGMTGLWTAVHIKQIAPETTVAVLEADICGAGASGANGGFAMTWWPKINTLVKLMGPDAALRLAKASEQSVADIGAFCAEHAIDADFIPGGWLWAATNSAQVNSWDATIDVLDGLRVAPFERLSRDRVGEVSGSDRHLGGVFEAGVATVQPAALTRGLRQCALAAGVHVWEKSPMTSFETTPTTVTARTPSGTVTAGRLVLATNAWLARYRQIRRHLLVLGSDVVATDPLPDRIAESAWKQGMAISDSRRLVHYYRTTRDGRIVFGKGGGRISFGGRFDAATWGSSTRTANVRAHLTRIYPDIAGIGLAGSWAGAVDYSCDGLPFIGHLANDPKVSFAAGFSGNGVGPAHLVARVLASLATGIGDEWADSPLIRTPRTYLPPEPIRYLGGQVVRKALERKESAEDRETTPSRAVALVAGLDPTSFVG
jgi:glycine/D-amino acid oxidase-like deaminating enzyme